MSTMPKNKTTDLITVMEYWAKTIAKNGGVAAVTIQEGADRLRELQAHIEKAETELAASRAECERLRAMGSWVHTCIHHTDEQRTRAGRCPVCATAECNQLHAEVERLRHLEAVLRSSAADMTGGSITAGGVADLRAENERLRRAYVRPDDIRAQLESAIARAELAEAECLEQARLLGMSASREASLLGKISRLEQQLEKNNS